MSKTLMNRIRNVINSKLTTEEKITNTLFHVEEYQKDLITKLEGMKYDLLSEFETKFEVDGEEVETIIIDKKEWTNIYNQALDDVIDKIRKS